MSDYMGRTLADAIEAARKREDNLPHIVQVLPSDYDTIIMADRITALEAENERLNRSIDGWKADASKYANDAEYWRLRFMAGKAEQ